MKSSMVALGASVARRRRQPAPLPTANEQFVALWASLFVSLATRLVGGAR